MTYGTSLLLIGVCVGGGYFQGGRVKKKYCCVREGGHYMNNKNIGGVVNST